MMVHAEKNKIIDCKSLSDSLPAALLPVSQGESIICGAAAHQHRRGTGLPWPQECQFPVNADYENGVGRVPLFLAWSVLAKNSKDHFSGTLGDTSLGWRPYGNGKISSPAEKIIAESYKSWAETAGFQRAVLVVPDCLGEAAQQALIDNMDDIFLIPRPVAVALSWSRKHVDEYRGMGVETEEGVSVGHLIVITLAIDKWEVVPIEIRAKIYKKKLWLVPVRNRSSDFVEFPRVGISFLTSLINKESTSVAEVWRKVVCSNTLVDIIEGKLTTDAKQTDSIRESILSGESEFDKHNFGKWNIWEDYVSVNDQLSANGFVELVSERVNSQLKNMSEKANGKCLGVMVDGACANIKISDSKTLGWFVAKGLEIETDKILFGDGFEAARGAAITADALESGVPCYRETLIPIGIHYHRKNDFGDMENAYKSLVAGTTIRAGDEYKSREPVRGLKIQQGENLLKLILRRQKYAGTNAEKVFRSVTAEISNETQRDELVEINAFLKPGQGFAKVIIKSERNGVFDTMLDWRTMEECNEPSKPKLAYLPKVSRVEFNLELLEEYNVEILLEEAVLALKNETFDLEDRLRKLKDAINKWPSADQYDMFRGHNTKNDIFLHYGSFSSDGVLNKLPHKRLANDFIDLCELYLKKPRPSSKVIKILFWTASWLYLACPQTILESSMTILLQEGVRTKKYCLAIIGLGWHKKDELRIFFKYLEKVFTSERQSINDWLRATRNIVRFREHSLSKEVISSQRLQTIIDGLYGSLKDQVEKNNYHQIFSNCILTFLFLLKRRRYDPNFMGKDSQRRNLIASLFNKLLKEKKGRLSQKQLNIVEITLRFLNEEGSESDLRGILIDDES